MKFSIAYLAAGLIMLVLDAVWLKTMAPVYRRELAGVMMEDGFNLAPAAVFYFLYVAGVVLLAVLPGLEKGGPFEAMKLGAIAGLFAYGTYNLTNAATLKTWSNLVISMDMAWGMVLTAVTAGLSAYIVRMFVSE